MRLVSRPWRAAVHAHPGYSRDIVFRAPPSKRMTRQLGLPASPEDVPVVIPLESFISRVSCSKRTMRLHLSAQFSEQLTVDAIIALIAQNLHRMQLLDVVFRPADAPALLRALSQPAPRLETFCIKLAENSTVYDDGSLDYDSPADDEYQADDETVEDGESWDPDSELDETYSADHQVSVPGTIFGGDAPRLATLSLHNAVLSSNEPYTAFLNVRRLAVTVSVEGCTQVAQLLALCPNLVELDVTAFDGDDPFAGTHDTGYLADAAHVGSPLQPLSGVRLGSGFLPPESELKILAQVTHPAMNTLVLLCPSTEAMHCMYSHLADSAGPLIFTVREDRARGLSVVAVRDPRRGHARIVEIPKLHWWIWECHVYDLLSIGLAPIERYITSIHMSAADLCSPSFCEILGRWSAVSVVRIDIVTREDVDDATSAKLPQMQSRFPALTMVLLYAPATHPSKLRTYAQKAILGFFCGLTRVVHAAYTRDIALADTAMHDPDIAALKENPQCHMWAWKIYKKPRT